ncbi:hypothetical protein GCM10009785_01420 [Brooklawnia cerclae]|uniref:Uncharacterized protein n=1 Tax=Brooklawnia cerclae TaxID=349934 RepID=A0ABX0SCZ3_9ACTN|nr:hypothetical protein [Brooklawnia cerclae]NIH56263.1 hypothetical protein [Brooklawnia cerclae]
MNITRSSKVTATDIANHVAWAGHQSRSALVQQFKQARNLDQAIDQAVKQGLIQQAPRIGGYVATGATRRQTFGNRFADAWEAGEL